MTQILSQFARTGSPSFPFDELLKKLLRCAKVKSLVSLRSNGRHFKATKIGAASNLEISGKERKKLAVESCCEK